jgi:hypothetical protein
MTTIHTGTTGATGSTGQWGQQGAQGFKGPRGVIGATGWGYGKTTGPTGVFGYPVMVSPAANPTYLTTTNIGTLNVLTSDIVVDTSGLVSGNTGSFWTFSNNTNFTYGIGGISPTGYINLGGVTGTTYKTAGRNSFTLVYDGSNLLPM